MEKKTYETAELEYIKLKKEDIITLSGGGDDYIDDNGGFDTPDDEFAQ